MKVKYRKWLSKNTESLVGKTVAVTGSTGGLGYEICNYLAYLGASLLLLDRNRKRSEEHKAKILSAYPEISVKCFTADLSDISSVEDLIVKIEGEKIDVLIHNAGAYSIPRCKTSTGYDNVFQINFISPYYITRRLIDILSSRGARVVVVGSIAHNYSKTKSFDMDFSENPHASKVYGNAKRYLMYSLSDLLNNTPGVSVSVTHPGIAFTNITSHYPKLIFAIIKYPMKLIFMHPRRAALSILYGVFNETKECEWIGPCLFDVWGMPKKKKLNTAKKDERIYISSSAEDIYAKIISEREGEPKNENQV